MPTENDAHAYRLSQAAALVDAFTRKPPVGQMRVAVVTEQPQIRAVEEPGGFVRLQRVG
jgi:hypothetical protein